MHFSDVLTSVFCLALSVGVLALGSAGWLAIRGRPEVLDLRTRLLRIAMRLRNRPRQRLWVD